jgi:hypothetical protein
LGRPNARGKNEKGSGFSWPRDAGWAERPKAREEKEIFYFFFFFSNISKPFSNSF